jgi:hypothetical protein
MVVDEQGVLGRHAEAFQGQAEDVQSRLARLHPGREHAILEPGQERVVLLQVAGIGLGHVREKEQPMPRGLQGLQDGHGLLLRHQLRGHRVDHRLHLLPAQAGAGRCDRGTPRR